MAFRFVKASYMTDEQYDEWYAYGKRTLALLESLEPGDWIYMEFGSSKDVYYILDNNGDRFVFSSLKWCSDYTQSYDSFLNYFGSKKTIEVFAHTKKRWWWKYISWFRDTCPFQIPEIPPAYQKHRAWYK